jgi:hypothetical protein
MVSFSWSSKQTSNNPPDFFNRSTEKQRRLAGYKNVWEAYLSELPDPIKKEGPANDNVKVNPIRSIVDVGVYFLFGDEVRFEVSPNRSTELGLQKVAHDSVTGPGKPKLNVFGKPVHPDNEDRYQQYHDDQKAQGDAEFKKRKDQEAQDSQDQGQDPKKAAPPAKSDSQDPKQQGQDPKQPQGKFDPKDPQAQKGGFGQQKPGFTPTPKAPMDKMAPATPKYLTDLNKVWKANRKRAFLHEMGVSGALHGDVFVKFVPNGAGTNYDMPRLVLLDPANVDVITHPDDCDRVIKYIISYVTEDENGKVVGREQEITPVEESEDEYGTAPVKKWEIRNFENAWNHDVQSGWHPGQSQREQMGPTKTWDYPWPPIEHCQNMKLPHMFWGMPDIDESAVELVQSIQRAMSSLNKVVRLHGSPRLFAKGVMPELVGQIDASPDGVITLPAGAGIDSDLKILEGLQNMTSQIEFVENMRKQLLEGLGVPAIALGDINTMSTSMSGVNMSILYAPILQKTQLKRINYGDLLSRINEKILILMGHEDTEEFEDLEIVWPESMPGSQYLERQTLLEDMQLGLSKHTSLLRLGYDPEKEFELAGNEMQSQLDMQNSYLPDPSELLDAAKKPPVGGEAKNNNPAGAGNRGGSMGAAGNSTPKNKANPSTSKSRGGPPKH